MNIRFYNGKILRTKENHSFEISEGELWVKGNKIVYLGDGKDLDGVYQRLDEPFIIWDREIDARGYVIMPGFKNAHTHSAMTFLRSFADDVPLQKWLNEKVFPLEAKLTGEDIYDLTKLAILEYLTSGITAIFEMYLTPDTIAEACMDMGMRCVLTSGLNNFSSSVSQMEEEYQKWNKKNSLISYQLGFHAEYTCFDHIVAPYSADCKSLGGRMHIHLSETKKEHDECVEKYGKTPAKWFYDLGTFDCPTAAAHCVFVTEEDMALMLEKGVSPIHNPTSNMKLGSGFAPIQRMLDLGLNVALGTDGAASNNNLNMMEELHLAAVLHNGYHQDPTILKPVQLLAMATRNGAKLQGREDTGELAVGKKADIIALDLTKPHLYPNLDPLALTVYSAQGSDVVMTMVDGRILYENGEFLTLDAEKILYEANAAAKRLNS